MSIAKKVTLVVTLLAGLLLLGGGYTGHLFWEQETRERVIQDGRLLAQVARVTVESSLENYGQMGAIEDLVSRAMPVRLVFYGGDGRAVAPVPPEEEPVVNNRARRVMERNQEEEQVDSEGYIYRVPLLDRPLGRVAGCLELHMDLAALLRPRWHHVAAGVAGGLLLLFAVAVGAFSLRAIQRPIQQLMGGMDHVIRGDLTHAMPLERNDEIGRIAYRFNEMTAQLRDAQLEIHRAADAKLKLEQRVRQSEKLATIGQLSAEIAHEVGTPLNVISGRARLLARKAGDAQAVAKNAGIIADQAARITKIIQQMLDLARERSPAKSAVQLPALIDDVLTLLEQEVARAGVRVALQVPRELPAVLGDADGLQQVLINLVQNAIQAMPGGGTLTLRGALETRRKEGLALSPPQPYVQVCVADDGEGIPEQTRQHIFEPFFSTKRRGEGTGLGLTVVQGIVKAHDGWIEVTPAAPRGTVFCVYLPAVQAPPQGSEP